MIRRPDPQTQWVRATKRRKYARVAGRFEAALDIVDHTVIPDSRKKLRSAKRRATRALQDALESLGAS